MAKIIISLPDELLNYIDQKVENRSKLIASLLKEWQEKHQDEELAAACALVDELELGWEGEWQNIAMMMSYHQNKVINII